jgi:aminoglycoside phosphotransferase (APT) family kinase protein
VFRFPVAAEAQTTLRREIALLPDLRAVLPLSVPAFEHIGEQDGWLVFVGYRALDGAPLTPDRFDGLGEGALASLAGFLRAVHAFPVDAARRAGVGDEQVKGAYHPAQRDLIRGAADVLTAVERARLHAIFDAYEREHLPDARGPVLLHADLKPAHVMYDARAGRVAGVID